MRGGSVIPYWIARFIGQGSQAAWASLGSQAPLARARRRPPYQTTDMLIPQSPGCRSPAPARRDPAPALDDHVATLCGDRADCLRRFHPSVVSPYPDRAWRRQSGIGPCPRSGAVAISSSTARRPARPRRFTEIFTQSRQLRASRLAERIGWMSSRPCNCELRWRRSLGPPSERLGGRVPHNKLKITP